MVMVGSLCWSLFLHMYVLSMATAVLANKSRDLLATCPAGFHPMSAAGGNSGRFQALGLGFSQEGKEKPVS